MRVKVFLSRIIVLELEFNIKNYRKQFLKLEILFPSGFPLRESPMVIFSGSVRG